MTLKQMIEEMQAESLPNIPPEQFGIDLPAHEGNERHELPMPATYVIRPDGRIAAAFVHEDYTKRMEPSDILACLQQDQDR